MNKQLENLNPERASSRNSLIAGVAIIVLGLIALAAQLGATGPNGLLILPALAAVFLAWGLLTRTFGLVIPGGILAGIAFGAFLAEGPLAGQPETLTGGVVLVAFSFGWVLVSLRSPLTARSFQWWPRIPAAILATIGALLIAGGSAEAVAKVLGFAWPVILIGVGAWVLIRRK